MADADWAKYTQLRGEALPQTVALLGETYQLKSLLKQDFYAAVAVYDKDGGSDAGPPPQVLLKVYHTDRLGIIPLGWLGRMLWRRETAFLADLSGVRGIPQLLGRYGESGLIREYVPGCNLREHTRKGLYVDAEYFPKLEAILAEVHARGISHNDLSKPENVLVTPEGDPILIDFQIALRTMRWGGPLKALSRAIIGYMQGVDRYHLAKQYSRRRPMDFTPEQRKAMERKGWIITAHGYIRRPYRAVRHMVLRNFMMAEASPSAVPAPHVLEKAPSPVSESTRSAD